MPEAIPRAPRRDDTAADARSLEQMGRIEPQPIPAPSIQPFLEPDLPPAEPGE
ncbi:hypothetical protein MUK60_07125 [Streptomyces sp. LRE541]|uniref:hypothetical protein n=1 Tax=Streptomyces sp. LRE541 TaxID=2931983 RepID=UPI00200E5886|nr:hypothetical protein [Streptomyces sp. LRE541]UPZ27603.1 hypothetical protein MUK60_07125 [Streptomyces sp. LRE541]